MRLPQRLCWCMDPAAQVLEQLQLQKLWMVRAWHPPSNSGKCRLQVSPTDHVIILLVTDTGRGPGPMNSLMLHRKWDLKSPHWITDFFPILSSPAFRPCTKEKRPQAILPPPPSVTIWCIQQIRMTWTHSKWILQKSEFPYHKRHPQRYLWVSCPTPLEVGWPHTWIQSPPAGPTMTHQFHNQDQQQQMGKRDSCKSGWRTRPRGCSSRCWLCSHLELKPRQAAQKLRVMCSMIVFQERLIDLGCFFKQRHTSWNCTHVKNDVILNVLVL